MLQGTAVPTTRAAFFPLHALNEVVVGHASNSSTELSPRPCCLAET